ncbi:unnamed protein product [Urochloa decumbens]|uniref:HR-like lesion-inducer n=1 Tax=Urochloa decumbens TaxID=240449 RepID=A0ABC8XT14_9POAL
MGFVSFVGRVLFVAAFLLSAYQEFNEFGTDGGPAAKALQPKFNVFVKNISSHLGVAVPHVELKHVIAATIALKGLGGLLFILSSSLGAYLLLLYLAFITPIVHDFYNYDMEKAEFAQIFGKFTQVIVDFSIWKFAKQVYSPVLASECPMIPCIAGSGTHWSASLFLGHEELHPEAAGQEEGFQGKDKLMLSR